MNAQHDRKRQSSTASQNRKPNIQQQNDLQKKSNHGNKTSLNDMNKIKARLKTAIELYAERDDEQSKKHKKLR
jgi:hypothetical protein